MPSTSGKRTKPTTRKTTTRTTTKSTTAKTTKVTAKTAPKVTPKAATKSTSSRSSKPSGKDAERIQTLESTVTKLIEILDSEFKSELRQGPKNVSAKLRNAGLIK